MKTENNRRRTLILFCITLGVLLFLALSGWFLESRGMETDFTRKNLPPSLQYPFGTDWMGRDMLARSICGLSMSIRIGVITAVCSAGIALFMGTMAAMGKRTDSVITWSIDLIMGIPHLLLLLLISFACGKGVSGVIVGVTLSHWMALARVLRGETLQLKESIYIQASRKLGRTRVQIVKKHMLPHLLPQLMTGLVLLFPHAILHEASITFLGFGLPPEQPAIGIILSESMQYLVLGKWWLAVFPSLMLAGVILLFERTGSRLRQLTDPAYAHR